jgi:uncharacterized protein YndB with AHSA1/START domain
MMAENEDWLTRSCTVNVPPAEAWRVFVDRFADWWPPAYSFSQDALETIGIEPVQGGRCFERDRDGHQLAWGTVTTADPPSRLAFFWQITADRRIEPDTARASEVEVVFAGVEGGTRVTLTHRGFARHGGDWQGYRDGMGSEQGWSYCLACFAARAQQAG